MPPRKSAKPVKGKTPRKMPAFTKPSATTLAAFERATAGLPGVEHRTMFGYPSVFLNGNMLASIFQDRVMVRLAAADRADAMMRAGAHPFEPTPGRGMKEYVDFPAAVIADTPALRGWIERGSAYVKTLPKKASKKKR
jgi:TfoX/Sxy family transcriptional regulator of competence genes